MVTKGEPPDGAPAPVLQTGGLVLGQQPPDVVAVLWRVGPRGRRQEPRMDRRVGPQQVHPAPAGDGGREKSENFDD